MTSEPRFYIVRPGSIRHYTTQGDYYEPNCVPLIPMDLLPEYIQVEGVWRHLPLAETAGMQNLGQYPAAGEPLRVSFELPPGDETVDEGRETGCQVVSPDTSQDTSRCGETEHVKENDNHVNKPESSQCSSQDSQRSSQLKPHQGLASSRYNTNNTSSTLTGENSSTLSPKPKKASSKAKQAATYKKHKNKGLCKNFIRHGSCEFGRMCHWRHSPPSTREHLNSAGLDDWPEWFYQYVKTGQMPAAESADGSRRFQGDDVVRETKSAPATVEARADYGKENGIADLIDLSE